MASLVPSMERGVKNVHVRVWACSILLASLVCVSASHQDPAAVLYPTAGDIEFAHDPTAIKSGKTWYVITTGRAPGGGLMAIRTSNDLIHWKLAGHVFDDLPKWVVEKSPRTRDLWAPDISFVHGEFRVYYAYSQFGKNTSGLGLVTNQTLDAKSPKYKWVDQGLVFESKATDDFNAIDPNFIRDRQGRQWLSFGSFWTGIKLFELDPRTGKPLKASPLLYSIASRAKRDPMAKPDAKLPPDSQAIEAPYIVHHGSYYYLFVSWDLCCRGTKSTYRTVVGRSHRVTGPYLDRDGKAMSAGGGTQILGPNSRWAGAGGESVLLQHGAPDLIFFHAYDKVTGRSSLQISTISWQDDWPMVAG